MKMRKIAIIIVLSMSLLLGGLTIQSEAVNETNQTATSATEKSSNANLSDLGIKPHDFKGFKPGTTSYEVTVPEGTETIEVYAKTQHAKATVTGTGKKKLEKGKNNLEVVVTAEDRTEKTYTLQVVRGEAEEKEENESSEKVDTTTDSNGLSDLKIKNVELSPEFRTDVYEYTAKYVGEDTKLNLETKVTDESYIVDITGNSDLQEGENIITILVSKNNGDNVATYQIIVDKRLEDKEAIASENAQKKEQKILIGAVVAIAILILIVLGIIKHKKAIMEEEFFEQEESEENQLPKALKKETEEEEIEIEKMSKDEIKEKFLNHYSNHVEEYEETKPAKKSKGKHKGKRFK